jgi:hypothetical protein
LIRNEEEIADIEHWQSIIIDNELDNEISLFRCKRIVEIVKNAGTRIKDITLDNTLPIVPLFFTFWSDDFDPNKSIKGNRQSVWIKTMTIFTLSGSGSKNKVTYPLSLSMKGTDHNLVEIEFCKEINQLKNGKPTVMYSRYHHSFVYIHADVFSILNDQPERRSNLHLGNGNSTLHARFGYIMNIKQVVEAFRSCEACTESIIDECNNNNTYTNFNYEWRSGNCKKCTAWMFHFKSPLLHFSPEKDFPIKSFKKLLLNGKLCPYKVSRSKIMKGIKLIINKLDDNKVKLIQAKAYLRYLGINNTGQLLILEKKHEYKLPSTWYGFNDLNVFVEVPMHLLMLGVMKAVVIKVGSWLRSINQGPNFLSLVKGKLRIVKKMNIEWCKVLEYPRTDKTGGWVSENFVAMTRLCVWFYSILKQLPINEQYTDPVTNYTTWNKKECEKWLQVRDIDKTGLIKDLKKKLENI